MPSMDLTRWMMANSDWRLYIMQHRGLGVAQNPGRKAFGYHPKLPAVLTCLRLRPTTISFDPFLLTRALAP
jgi:hypothetical protein